MSINQLTEFDMASQLRTYEDIIEYLKVVCEEVSVSGNYKELVYSISTVNKALIGIVPNPSVDNEHCVDPTQTTWDDNFITGMTIDMRGD